MSKEKNWQFGDIKSSIPPCKLKRVIRETRCLQHHRQLVEHGLEPCGHSCFPNTDPSRVPRLLRLPVVVTCEEVARCSMATRTKARLVRGQACFGPSLWGHSLFPESGWMASASTCSAARASAELQPVSGRTTHLRRAASRRSPVCPSRDGSGTGPHLPSTAPPLLSCG